MAFRFHRGIPNVSIFHSPSSPASVQALKMLRSALADSYPPSVQPPKPLEFNLEVVENTPPTTDQFSTILSYTKKSISSLLSTPPDPDKPTTVKDLRNIVQYDIQAMKWPVVVNWDDGQAAIGEVDGVLSILESLRRKRDGEEKTDSNDYKPKGWFK